uniref:Uncharacterized protein n=1 Tax=Melopsittacus undulatus TaxID=13146 RepID=A0A8C6N9I4_MELUD
MDRDLPWLNHSDSPRAAGRACTGDGSAAGPCPPLLKQGNLLFLNLAIAELLVGMFRGTRRGRGLGRGLCKLWLMVDYLVCTASVFNIVPISLDRFIAVIRAVSYRDQKGVTRNAVLQIITVWIAAFLLYGPAILIWEHIAQESIPPERECHAEFFYNWYFLMIASTIEFLTPFITVTYFKYFPQHQETHIPQERKPITFTKFECQSRPSTTPVAKSLAIIVCVFRLCWAPYTLLMIIRAACLGHCVQYSLYEISFWLLWVNSAFNPVLYPLCHMSFRRAFIKLLFSGKAKIHPYFSM